MRGDPVGVKLTVFSDDRFRPPTPESLASMIGWAQFTQRGKPV